MVWRVTPTRRAASDLLTNGISRLLEIGKCSLQFLFQLYALAQGKGVRRLLLKPYIRLFR
jgi:hypothetical protein